MAGGDGDDIRTQKTFRGFAHPEPTDVDVAETPVVSRPTQPAPTADGALTESGELYLPPGTVPKHRSPFDSSSLVEIEVSHQHGPAPRMDQPPQVLEVWTQNRVYTMDATMRCVQVEDRATQRINEQHPFLGYRLVGGQHRDGDTFELSYPYPRPGTEAVFEHPEAHQVRFSRTSPVHRVVLRLHVVTVAPSRIVPTWSDITHPGGGKRPPGR